MFCLFVYAEAIPSSYTSLEIDLEFLKEQVVVEGLLAGSTASHTRLGL